MFTHRVDAEREAERRVNDEGARGGDDGDERADGHAEVLDESSFLQHPRLCAPDV